MLTLGISAYFHDSAAALVRDGVIIAASQEERFTRLKHDRSFPTAAIHSCLDIAGADLSDVDRAVFYEDPNLKRQRQLSTLFRNAPSGWAQAQEMFASWASAGLSQRRRLLRDLRELDDGIAWTQRLDVVEHHRSHAAAAFFPSPFEEAAILTVDAVGEHATTTVGSGRGARIDLLREIRFPHSLGMLYSAFTSYLGFKVNSGEYKVMGLAPYGTPTARQLIFDHLVDVRHDGSFRLDMNYFDYTTGLGMTNDRFHELFGGPPRRADDPITARHMNIASSIQAATNEIMVRLARYARELTGHRDLCLAGGVALNCVANAAIRQAGCFERIWVQPAAGDAGSAIGAALARDHAERQTRPGLTGDLMHGAFLGPSFGHADVVRRLDNRGAVFSVLDAEASRAVVVESLSEGGVVGWFQGRMEFGPRALGARSILADARRSDMQRTLNLKIKYREGFRPFAPVVLEERAAEWFELDEPSPYMLFTADVAPNRRVASAGASGFAGLDEVRSQIPAVTHVDGTARVQTVNSDDNQPLHALLRAFEDATGCPVLVNTSFNVRGEPIVCTPEDAYDCFMGTEMDLLVVENCVLRKSDQPAATATRTRGAFAPD